MRVLITGGCGYLGYSVVQALLADKSIHQIYLYDNLSNGNLNFFLGTPFSQNSKLSLIVGDILDNYALKKALQTNEIDTVVHLAAKASTPFADHNAHSFDQVNNWGTACLMGAIEDSSSVQKIINLSSISVYGHSHGAIVNENTIAAPKTFYGISKLRGEKHVRRLFPQREVYTIRAGNVFGYNPCIRIHSVVNKFVFDAHFNNRVEIHGSGLQNRSFVHVESLAKTIAELVCEEKDFPSLFNRFDCNLSILDIADIIQNVYPQCERIFMEQHMEMRSVRAASNNFENPSLSPKELIPLIQQISNNFTFSPKSQAYEKSVVK